MGLSRRKFTREFKVTAIRRLEAGGSIAEVARAFEVNRTCCTAGDESSARDRATRFPGLANGVGKKPDKRSWNARSASRRWRSIF